MADVNTVVIGAGVVGLAIAYELSSRTDVLVLEPHDRVGSETSSRNSEFIHAGLYYPPGSLRARLCVEGKQLLATVWERLLLDDDAALLRILKYQRDHFTWIQLNRGNGAHAGAVSVWIGDDQITQFPARRYELFNRVRSRCQETE